MKHTKCTKISDRTPSIQLRGLRVLRGLRGEKYLTGVLGSAGRPTTERPIDATMRTLSAFLMCWSSMDHLPVSQTIAYRTFVLACATFLAAGVILASAGPTIPV